MAEKMVSPGVFTRENDQSYLASGVSAIGAAVIGTTESGPAFVPTPVSSPAEFEALFGATSDSTYVPYVVKSYLQNAGIINVVRVLGTEGWLDANTRVKGQNNLVKLVVNGKIAVALGVTAGTTNFSVSGLTVTGSGSNFTLNSASVFVSCSLEKSNPNYIVKVFGTDPLNTSGNTLSSNLYVYSMNIEAATPYTASTVTVTSSQALTFLTNSDYSAASTPWIQSQLVAGAAYDLFRFWTLSDGTNANMKYKVEISNITKPVDDTQYGVFTVTVREYSDLDFRQSVVETYSNCNLDPTSKNYILKKIGDKYKTIDSEGRTNVSGTYDSKSKYIRVEASSTLETLTNTIIPFGHGKYYNPITGSAATFFDIPFKIYQGTADIYQSYVPFGIDFTNLDHKAFLTPIADSVTYNTSSSLNLDTLNGHASSSYTSSLSGSAAPTEMLHFIVGFQGGWDGLPPNRVKNIGTNIAASNVFGHDCSGAMTEGTLAFKKAINAISNPDELDINLIVMPGILESLHPYVTDYARTLCLNRGDCFYIMDSVQFTGTKEDAVSAISAIDNSYVGTYYPWVQIDDNVRGKRIWVPPSVVIPAVYSFNDKVSAPWWAPAGLNRGGLTEVIEVKRRLNNSDRNYLYENRVNPIAVFPGTGPAVWGQKTLQKKASALDRINVRRLLLEIEKFIASTSRFLVFEPNVANTRTQFLSIVNPYLTDVQKRSGVYAFKVVMDESNNDSDAIDRLILRGAIYIQPTKAAEFIELTYNITPTNATFSS